MGREITCPGCKAKLTVPETASGKTGRCRKCGATFVVAAAEPSPEAETTATTPPAEASETTTRQIVCLSCGGDLPPDAVICVHCGLDLRTGEALSTRVEAEPSGTSPTSRLAPTPQRGGRPTLLWVYAIPNIALPVLILASIATVVLVPACNAQREWEKDLIHYIRVFE